MRSVEELQAVILLGGLFTEEEIDALLGDNGIFLPDIKRPVVIDWSKTRWDW